MMILWASTDIDYDIWTMTMEKFATLSPEGDPPEVKMARKNRFVTCLYSALTFKEGRKPRVHSVDV